MPTVELHILEEDELRKTSLSCVPQGALPPSVSIATSAFFSTEKQFAAGLHNAFAAMLQRATNVLHILIISAHGQQGTGTHIEVAPGELIRLADHAPSFEVRPPQLVIFVSACWGGYPSVIQALRSGTGIEPPFIVAPLVPVRPKHANELQRRLTSAMASVGNGNCLDALLEQATSKLDAELAPEYGENVFRFVRRNGELVPNQGRAGLAAPMLPSHIYLVVAVQRLPSASDEPPAIAIVQSQKGRYWRIPTSSLPNDQCDDEVYGLVGKFYRFRAKISKPASKEDLGDLVEVSGVELASKVPGFLRLARPYEHAGDRTTVKGVKAATRLRHACLVRCRRCNWASFSITSQKSGGKLDQSVDAICHRNECPEH